jgi:hypothetical protein
MKGGGRLNTGSRRRPDLIPRPVFVATQFLSGAVIEVSLSLNSYEAVTIQFASVRPQPKATVSDWGFLQSFCSPGTKRTRICGGNWR